VKLEDHPTVRRLSEQVKGGENEQRAETMLNGTRLRRLALDCGADDASLVEIARPGAQQRPGPGIVSKYFVALQFESFVLRGAREVVRGAPRSVAKLEFH
jgi:hypothetical protein